MFDEHRLRPARDLGKQAPRRERRPQRKDAIAKCIRQLPGGLRYWHDLSKKSQYKPRIVAKGYDHVHAKPKIEF